MDAEENIGKGGKAKKPKKRKAKDPADEEPKKLIATNKSSTTAV